MKITPTAIPEVQLITPSIYKDDRGFFLETYRQDRFNAANIPSVFVQDNQSFSQKHTLRGLHYQQSPYAQAKLVRVIFGEILDVAVDLRKTSPTFKQHVAIKLDAEKKEMLYIPEGFAHGFYVLSDIADVTYKCSNFYHNAAERSIVWNDPDLAIPWPISDQTPPVLSQKDQNAVTFKNADLPH